MFRPKAIYLRCENDEYLILGPNNLTSSGIKISALLSCNQTGEDAFADYSEVSVSVILQYNIPGSVKEGEMPNRVADRCRRLLDYLDGFSSGVTVDDEPFRQWIYDKDNHL